MTSKYIHETFGDLTDSCKRSYYNAAQFAQYWSSGKQKQRSESTKNCSLTQKRRNNSVGQSKKTLEYFDGLQIKEAIAHNGPNRTEP